MIPKLSQASSKPQRNTKPFDIHFQGRTSVPFYSHLWNRRWRFTEIRPYRTAPLRMEEISMNKNSASSPESTPPTTSAPTRRYRGGWTTGILLILIGVIFFIQNLTAVPFHNWWAVFILIPAVSSFSRAWEIYQAQGNQLTRGVTRSIFTGLLFVTITVVFLFSLDWNLIVPLLLILLGVSGLLSAFLR